MKLYSHEVINHIKRKYKFNLSKGLGQNFLTDKYIIDEIIYSSLINEKSLVIEIGPGIGVLTAEAAEKAGKVIAVELDDKLIPILKDTLQDYENVEIINQDILKTDVNGIIEKNLTEGAGAFDNVRIIGNLPYYITTPIIMKLLEDGVRADSITVMMQKEVADRIKATAGTKGCGAISAAVQYHCEVTEVVQVPKEVFVPEPKVDSAVLRLDIRKEKPVKLKDEELFFKCIKAGFGQRRKTMSNSMNGLAGLNKEEINEIMSSIGIDAGRRGETMSIEEFAELANAIYERLYTA